MIRKAFYGFRIFCQTSIVCISILTSSCVVGEQFPNPEKDCISELTPNLSIRELLEFYKGETVMIKGDNIIEGYVISSDVDGNFFGSLHVQDKVQNQDFGLQIDIDLQDSQLFYPFGSKILVNLKGLYLGKSKGIYKLGSANRFFGQVVVSRIPASRVSEHLIPICKEIAHIVPRKTDINGLTEIPSNTLIALDSVEFATEEIGKTFAELKEETSRQLSDCIGNSIKLVTSGFSSFQNDSLPKGNGTIIAVLLKENKAMNLVISTTDDINFTNPRCETVVDQFTSSEFFISEIGDPDNNSKARFVELYNAGSEDLPLKGWSLERYTNDSETVSSRTDLSGNVVKAGRTFIIASDTEIFLQTYGIEPNLEGGQNSPADSNGDDNLLLIDPFGIVVDVFGRIGEDGSATDHEFEDGRALRKAEIRSGSLFYNSEEWIIYNDTGAAGTIKEPQMAPQDFTPGKR